MAAAFACDAALFLTDVQGGASTPRGASPADHRGRTPSG